MKRLGSESFTRQLLGHERATQKHKFHVILEPHKQHKFQVILDQFIHHAPDSEIEYVPTKYYIFVSKVMTTRKEFNLNKAFGIAQLDHYNGN